MTEITQTFSRPRVEDVSGAVAAGLRALAPDVRGRRIALTAGSRGIRDIAAALRGAVAALREMGADPVVVAAMGSHGGGTAEGQLRVLSHLGVTPEAVDAPVVSAMEVVEMGRTPGGHTIYQDRHAAACDGIVVLNRIKPHTAFREPFGSGLMKMMAVGLGKAEAAAQIHRLGSSAMAQAIREIAEALVAAGRVIAGVALLENAFDETASVEVLPPDAIAAREPALFDLARRWMPALPVDEIDVLVVDEIGKNFSGTGMDVNIIGRWRSREIADPPSPRVDRIVALRLSEASEGNAQGVGLADVVTARLAAAVDLTATYLNAVTTTYLERAFLPVVAPSDRLAIELALRAVSLDGRPPGMMRIPNTLHLDRLAVSDALLPAVRDRPGVTIGPAYPWDFTEAGDLRDLP